MMLRVIMVSMTLMFAVMVVGWVLLMVLVLHKEGWIEVGYFLKHRMTNRHPVVKIRQQLLDRMIHCSPIR